MFDFEATLKEGDQALAEGNLAKALFYYWLVDFAFEDEEFPYFYTNEIGRKANKKFFTLSKKCKDKILESEEYLKFKEGMSIFESYRRYFVHFERAIKKRR